MYVTGYDHAPLESRSTSPLTAYGWLKLATVSSPAMKYILHTVNKNIISAMTGDFSKILITEGSPLVAYYYEL